jgi:hypothetical protein
MKGMESKWIEPGVTSGSMKITESCITKRRPDKRASITSPAGLVRRRKLNLDQFVRFVRRRFPFPLAYGLCRGLRQHGMPSNDIHILYVAIRRNQCVNFDDSF